MATAPSPNDLTRQQLDELDALLQKMLAVPLAPAEPPPPVPHTPPLAQTPLPPAWRSDPPAAVPAPSLAHLTAPEPPVTLKFEPPAPPPAPAPVAKAPKPAPVPPPPAPKPAPVVAAPKPVAPPKPAAPSAVVTPTPESIPVPLVAIPFVALNGLFDSACGLFGPPGRLLRSGFFKHLYGLIGLGLVVYTVLHVAQVQAWLTLPVRLPWPK